jgi:hypothetical protein
LPSHFKTGVAAIASVVGAFLTQNPKKSTRIVSFPEKGPGDARSANFKKIADFNMFFC